MNAINEIKTKGRSLKGQAAIERTSSSARSLKGQAAMEYLMTYGWAILVILIVLAILAYYMQMIRPVETCQFEDSGFACSSKAIYYNATNQVTMLGFRFSNNQGQAVEVSRVACTTMQKTDVTDAFLTSHGTVPATEISTGSSQDFVAVPCYDKDAAGTYTPVNLKSGSDFKGIIVIQYKYKNDLAGIPLRRAYANVAGPVS